MIDKIRLLFKKDEESSKELWKWLANYSKPYLPQIFLNLAISVAISIITVFMALVTKDIIDSATSRSSENTILTMIIIYVACILVNIFISGVSGILSMILSEKFSFGIRKKIYEHIIFSNWINIQKYHTGDIMTRLTSDASNISDGIVGIIPGILRCFIELAIVFFTLFRYSKLLAVLALLVAPITAIASVFLGHFVKKIQKKVQESESTYRAFLQESLSNLLIIKAFTIEEESLDKLVVLRDERFKWVYKKGKVSTIGGMIMSVTFQFGYIFAFAYGALQVSKNIITYGTMSVFLTLVNKVQTPIVQLATNIPKLILILASTSRIMEIEKIPIEAKDNRIIEPKGLGININNLSFSYDNKVIFDKASINIKPSEFVAVVGESGVGKTTLIRLIMSFLPDYSGSIGFYNNLGDKQQANSILRNLIAYVPQGNTLFSGTIKSNILMGNRNASNDELIQALKLSSAYNFVMQLPNKIDTEIGENGHGISEGQAQRIALARAFIRKSPILILDEVTSALDEKTELTILEAMKEIEPKPLCFIVTHRTSVLKYCDRSITIDNGKIIESGVRKV